MRPPSTSSVPLWHALGLDTTPGGRAPVVAVVGGGGKTSLVYALAHEAARNGLHAVVTGTTRFTRMRPMPDLIETPAAEAVSRLEAYWANDGTSSVVVMGGDEAQPQGRLAPLPVEAVDSIATHADLVTVEADGSKMRPFKAPDEHEPVIPGSATHLIAVVGLDALDAPLDEEHVHRPERVRAILDRPTCDADLIATVLASPLGGRKGAGERPFMVVVNKADLGGADAERLARAVFDAGVPRVAVTSLRDAGRPVWLVLGGTNRP